MRSIMIDLVLCFCSKYSSESLIRVPDTFLFSFFPRLPENRHSISETWTYLGKDSAQAPKLDTIKDELTKQVQSCALAGTR